MDPAPAAPADVAPPDSIPTPTEVVSFIGGYTQNHEWYAFAGTMLVGTTLALLLGYLIRTRLHKAFPTLSATVVVKIQRAASGPVMLLVFFYFLFRALDVFKGFPGWLWQWKHDNAPWFYGVLIFILAYRMLDAFVEAVRIRWMSEDSELDGDVATMLGRAVKLVFILLTGLVIAQNLGVQVTGLLAGLGFFGAAIALASQATIGNIIGYFEILADRLFRVGDRISFQDCDGFVEMRGLRCVRIRSLYGEKLTIPNKHLVDKQIRNYTRGKFSQIIITVGLTYEAGRGRIERAMALLREILAPVPRVDHLDIVFRQLSAYSLDVQIVLWCDYKTIDEYNAILNECNLRIKEAFDKEKLDFAFPTSTVHVSQGENPYVKAAADSVG
jgi:MscS family membrane protein